MESILEDQRKKFQEFLQEQVVAREDILLDGQTALSTVLLSLFITILGQFFAEVITYTFTHTQLRRKLSILYYCMRNFCNLIGLEQ